VCNVTLLISSREGIEIDHCPQCRGVWLDRGELDKIIERAAPSAVGSGGAPRREPDWDDRPRPRERYDERPRYDERERHHDYDDDRRYRKKKRGGFLEDLFDFD
jgi:Zn-finger nucleic acid-binding protein